ncbi:Uma2 family endonuclease [Hymenobacter sp. CRA2]|uniref:Uma2 family endonuclease n=1 Tax=Hymenobacter sp. CRA2 TaxID=1955620 RepID=UPI00098FBA8F|nr:Uma2 family endonuclease [Hymenobacter sp. CRA2]OON67429.1 restriction endonuclease [Hymenobacter sp. CRA2]
MMTVTSVSQLDPNKHYTYADYLTWRFDELVELIRGKVRLMSPAPLRAHQEVTTNIIGLVKPALRGKTCRAYAAPFDVRLSRATPNGDAAVETVVQPDICIICDPQKLDVRGCLGAPDWIIEILSPGNTAHDTKTKFDLYEETGVREYWMVTPGLKNIVVYLLIEGQYQLQGEYAEPCEVPVHMLPGLILAWDDVFENV